MTDNKPYNVKRYDDEPILLAEALAGYTSRAHLDDMLNEVRQVLDTTPEPLFVINSIDEASASLDDIIVAANMGARGQDPIWKHPNVRELVWVTTNPVAKLAVKGLDSPVFGNLKHSVFDTREEALAHIRD